jgi:hypothetical protein
MEDTNSQAGVNQGAEGADAGQKQDKQAAQKAVKLVKMVRDPEEYPEPHEANVHPDEVGNYALGGWRTK